LEHRPEIGAKVSAPDTPLGIGQITLNTGGETSLRLLTAARVTRFRIIATVRSHSTFGYNLSFEAGTQVDAGPVSLSVSAYDIAPWGPQTVISKVFRCTSGVKCSSTGKTTNRKNYLDSSVSTGDASLARDDSFNFGMELKPKAPKDADLEATYSRNVPLRLNPFRSVSRWTSRGFAVALALPLEKCIGVPAGCLKRAPVR
jgi:hypothetical protein